MALVPAICTQCGAQIEVDDTHEAGICKKCGTAFITEKAVNNYNNYITNNNNFAGATIIVKGESIDDSLKNVDNLIAIGKIYDAEKILKHLSIMHSTNKQIWITYSKLSYKKYIVDGCFDRYRAEKPDSYLLSPLDFNARCQKCLEELNQYKKYGGKDTYIEIDTLLKKVNEKKEASNKEILDYLYHTPKCFCFDSTWGSGCFPIFTWTDAEGKRYTVDKCTCGVVQEFIEDCEKNMEIYNNAIRTNNKLNDYKLVSYLCGEHLAQSLSNSHSWKVVGFNGYTLIIKFFYSDAWDNKREVYSTNILIQNNVNDILHEACKLQPQKACYIATCVYGSYDCPQVWTLRRFRDYSLDKTWYGRILIKLYYAISPALVKRFGNQKWFRAFWKRNLDNMVSKLNNKGIKNTQYQDRY